MLTASAKTDRRCGIAFDEEVVGGAGQAVRSLHHDLREAGRTLEEVAVRVGRQQRHVEDVGVGEVDAEDVARLSLHDGPRRHAAEFDVVGGAEDAVRTEIAIGDQFASGLGRTGGVERIGAQEHLMRGMRRIGLVLIDEGRGCVGVFVNVVGRAEDAVRAGLIGGAAQDEEVRCAGRRIEERIVRLQRNEDRTRPALGDEVEAVIEELAEEREPRVEGCRETFVRRDVSRT